MIYKILLTYYAAIEFSFQIGVLMAMAVFPMAIGLAIAGKLPLVKT